MATAIPFANAVNSVPPFELAVTDLIATATTILQEVRFNKNQETVEYQSELVDGCTFGKQDFGNGVVLDSTIELGANHVYSTTEDLFSIEVPKLESEYLKVDTKVFFKTSYAEYLFYTAVASGDFFETALSLFKERNILSEDEYYYQQVLANINTYEPVQATQKIVISLKDPDTATTDQEANQITVRNSQKIANAVQTALDNIGTYNSKYTDKATTFTKLNKTKLMTIVNKGIINENTIMGLANMFNPNESNNLTKTSKVIAIPETDVNNANVTANQRLICAIAGKDKFPILFGRQWAKGFDNPATGFYTEWRHSSYGIGVFKNVPCILIIADYGTTTPPAARIAKYKETQRYLKLLKKGTAAIEIPSDENITTEVGVAKETKKAATKSTNKIVEKAA